MTAIEQLHKAETAAREVARARDADAYSRSYLQQVVIDLIAALDAARGEVVAWGDRDETGEIAGCVSAAPLVYPKGTPTYNVPLFAAPPAALAEERGRDPGKPIAELMEQYESEGCDFSDMEWVRKASMRYVLTMPDSQVRCLLYALAQQPAAAVPAERDWTMIQSGDASIPAWVVHYANAIGAYMKGQNVKHWAVGPVQSRNEAKQPAALANASHAWAEGYRAGVMDERTSEASIGIAGFGAKIEPARENPYGKAQQPAAAAVPAEGLTVKEAWWAGARAALGLESDTPRDQVASAFLTAAEPQAQQPAAAVLDDQDRRGNGEYGEVFGKPRVPDGYALVPVEPTEAMIVAAREHHEGDHYLPVSLWRAMLAAANKENTND